MNWLKGIGVIGCFAVVLAVLVPSARAAEIWPTAVYFAGPVQIENQVFPAGSYIFERCPNEVTSRMMKIWSVDRGRWEGLIMGISARRLGDLRDTVVTYENRGEGKPEALRYWFFESWNIGMEFPVHRGGTTQVAQNGSGLVTVVARSMVK